MTETVIASDQGGAQRKVGAALGIGILLLPWLFSWFVLRRGYSTLARIVSFAWLLVFVLIVLGGQQSSNQVSTASATPPATSLGPASPSPGKETESAASAKLTPSQKNATRSAQQYLSMSGFSRNGLIQQLSSSAGDGYDLADATAAVDSLEVDWNENAARSAKQYLEMSGFSCKGLIEQLSSSAGDKYTVKQATYGARKAGAC